MFVSVIVCTHNPNRDYLAKTLCGLKSQTLAFEHWELLFIDNKSDAPLSQSIDLSWHPMGRILREEKLGLTPARLLGIREAKGDLLVFVDDDNVLDPDFLETAVRIANEKPFIGSWSGQCRPAFEVAPPEWTKPYWGNLVIREFADDRWSNLPKLNDTMPCGAGLCVRSNVAKHYVHLNDSGQRAFQLDRTGTSLVSGGDGDLAACACDLGLGVGLFASLKLQHLIAPTRLTEEYLSKLTEGIYFSAVVLDFLRGNDQGLRRWKVRWRERLQAFTHRGVHRRIQLSSLRGRQRGLTWVKQSRRNQHQ